jgi:hypothetical protein
MRHLAFPLMAAATLAAGEGRATTVQTLDLEGKIRRAHRVVHGRVLTVTPTIDPRGRGVRSEIAIDVLTSWKGALPPRILLRRAGGTLGHLTTWGDGLVRYDPGEEVFLFLEPHPDGGWVSIGVGIGTYHVGADGRLQGADLEPGLTRSSLERTLAAGPGAWSPSPRHP